MAKKPGSSASIPKGESSHPLREATAAENAQTAKLLLAECQSLLSATKSYRKAVRSVLRSDAEYASDVMLEEDLETAMEAMAELGNYLQQVANSLEEVRRRTLAIMDELQDLRY